MVDFDRATSRERGQALVLVSLSFTVLLLFAAMAVEMGRFVSERRFLQNAVDAAAVAGAIEWRDALARQETTAQAETSAKARALEALSSHFSADPTGNDPTGVADPPQYDPGCGTAPVCLIDGILVNAPGEPGAVRVAIRNDIDYTFGRLAGLSTATIGARAHAGPDPNSGGPLPIAVREFINGQPGGTDPCAPYAGGPSEYFRAVFATEATSCVGTKEDATGRTTASFDVPGPKVPILANNADANNGVSFRGFVALDIRNFSTPFSQKFYNGVTSSTNPQTLKEMQARYFCASYPGPDFPPVTSPPNPDLQVAALDGNSAGIAVDAMKQCYTADDLILVLVYDGDVRSIPEFGLQWPGGQKPYELRLTLSGTTGTYGNDRDLRVWANQAFSGTVSIDTLWDPNDPDNPFNAGTITSVPEITYAPNPVTPSLGNGTRVDIQNITTEGAPRGIYALIIRGTANSYANQVRYLPASMNIGGVARDFVINGPSPNGCEIAPAVGDPVTCTFSISNAAGGASNAYGGTVDFVLERLDGTVVQTFATGVGVGQNRQVTISTSSLAQGLHWFVVRASGLNQDGDKVTHLLPFIVNVAPSSSPGDDEYVDIKGFAIMRVTCVPGPQCMPPNRVDAMALTGLIGSLDDPIFDLLKEPRLLPWDYAAP